MRQAIDAIYENGAFKPLYPDQVHLADKRRVTLLVDDNPLPEPLRLALCIYEGLSEGKLMKWNLLLLTESISLINPW